ncbi:DNA-3-methyladenine glycosylase II [Solirubrobacter pauli]|uniref:DNA-3-methyladenine glycosylase II n=1 Tax=Solirubrobacter pauli TaxID=166793 RepID=A0A660LI58_9ACTN|nr:DNA-3-methyladenine glycosylase [Solirubrobacter pauli]RKQ93710.1 DNA-3-methyladenine glycosylase II [Solirubrobacter pauli]
MRQAGPHAGRGDVPAGERSRRRTSAAGANVRGAGSAGAAPDLPVLVRETVEPRWPSFRLGLPSLDGLTRRRGNGLVRLLHVDGAPVVVAASGTTFAARAATEEAAREGIARMRFASGIDDDLAEFHAMFRDDPLLGRAIRARPWLRVRRNPDPFVSLAWAITEQLIEVVRANAIQRRLIAAYGPRYGSLRDAPDAATVAGLAPAEIDACGLAPKRTLALRRAAREVAAGRVALVRDETARGGAASGARVAGDRSRGDVPVAPARLVEDARAALVAGPSGADFQRLLAIPEIGTWTIEVLASNGLGRLDVVPAGDLNYLKLVGRLTTGNPRAVADEDEVRGFFSAYAPYAGMAAQYLSGPARTLPSPRPGGTRWSAGSPRTVAA